MLWDGSAAAPLGRRPATMCLRLRSCSLSGQIYDCGPDSRRHPRCLGEVVDNVRVRSHQVSCKRASKPQPSGV